MTQPDFMAGPHGENPETLHADATFKLAQALEATKSNTEALRRYQEYLTILPKGEFAPESQKAIERLKPAQKTASPS